MAIDLSQQNLIAQIEQANIADSMKEEELNELGASIVRDYDNDESSRSGWMERNEEWMMLASQVKEDKSYPWPNASNIKYPLLTTAAIQFHARAQQALLKGNQPVSARIIGTSTEEKRQRAGRVGEFMSYQLLHEMEDWSDDMDRMLFVLPIVGLCFKKTYFSPVMGRNSSMLVLPQDLVINYHANDFLRARKSHILYKDANEVEELMRTGIYLDIDLPMPGYVENEGREVSDMVQGMEEAGSEEDSPFKIIEVHGWWDLDHDGYKEPWIITVETETMKVLRISARFTPDKIERDAKGRIAKITPIEYFTRYAFLPDLESKIYALGFGIILGPINQAVNTVTNQLIDSGTISNMGGGFLGRGVRLSRGGASRFRPGEWKAVYSTGDDLRKGIFPLPIKEPSNVLYSLLGTLIQSGEKIGSINDALLGENPGQNQPYSTTAAVLEQGLKVFVGIYKRIYRSLTKEFKNLYRLNSIYLDEQKYAAVLDRVDGITLTREDFQEDGFDIQPTADPDIASETQKLIKANSLLEKAAGGMPINLQEALRQVLEAEGHENIDILMNVPPPQPDPEIMLKMEELKHKQEFEWKSLELEAATKQHEALKDRTAALLNMAKASALGEEAEIKRMQLELEAIDKEDKNAIEVMKASMQGIQKAAEIRTKNETSRENSGAQRAAN